MESSILTKYNAIPRRRYANAKTGKRSIWLEEVLDRRVVIDRSDRFLHRDPGPFRYTCFKDVYVIPPKTVLTDETAKIFETEKTKDLTSMSPLVDLFTRVILKEWEPEKFHFVLHSSGFDSRIVSEIIRRLWRERGDSWLGQVLFVCNRFEGEQFRKIMRYQGWDESQYMVVREDVPLGEYHAPSLDFKTAWKRLNCVFGLPVNLFYYPIEAAQAEGRAPKDPEIQSWCNYLTPIDYTLKLDLWEKYRFLYFHAMGGRNFKGENMEFPGAHPLLLAEAIRYRTELKLNQVKREIVWHMNTGLRTIPETKTNLQGDWGRVLSDRLFRRTVADYNNSWYGKRVKARPNRTVGFDEWWRRWSIASFCQHLIREGYELEMK
jgi:hypothetical protein